MRMRSKSAHILKQMQGVVFHDDVNVFWKSPKTMLKHSRMRLQFGGLRSGLWSSQSLPSSIYTPLSQSQSNSPYKQEKKPWAGSLLCSSWLSMGQPKTWRGSGRRQGLVILAVLHRTCLYTRRNMAPKGCDGPGAWILIVIILLKNIYFSPLFNQVGQSRTHLQLRPGQDKAKQCDKNNNTELHMG